MGRWHRRGECELRPVRGRSRLPCSAVWEHRSLRLIPSAPRLLASMAASPLAFVDGGGRPASSRGEYGECSRECGGKSSYLTLGRRPCIGADTRWDPDGRWWYFLGSVAVLQNTTWPSLAPEVQRRARSNGLCFVSDGAPLGARHSDSHIATSTYEAGLMSLSSMS